MNILTTYNIFVQILDLEAFLGYTTFIVSSKPNTKVDTLKTGVVFGAMR